MGPLEDHLVVVRDLEADDVDAAVAMFAAVASEGRWIATEADSDWAARRREWTDGLDDPFRRSFVAIGDTSTADALSPDSTIVGVGSVRCEGGVAHLSLAVADGWRGRRIGASLLDMLVDASGELGAHKVALETWPHNERALRLYRSRGFVEEGRLVRHYRRSNGELWDSATMGLVLDTTSPGCPYDAEGDRPPGEP